MNTKIKPGTPITDAAVVSAEYIRREMDYYKHKFVLADVSRGIEQDRAQLVAAALSAACVLCSSTNAPCARGTI